MRCVCCHNILSHDKRGSTAPNILGLQTDVIIVSDNWTDRGTADSYVQWNLSNAWDNRTCPQYRGLVCTALVLIREEIPTSNKRCDFLNNSKLSLITYQSVRCDRELKCQPQVHISHQNLTNLPPHHSIMRTNFIQLAVQCGARFLLTRRLE